MADDDDTRTALLPLDAERVDPWETTQDAGTFRYFVATPPANSSPPRGAIPPRCGYGRLQCADGTLYDSTISVGADEPLTAKAPSKISPPC